jgi:surface polysaccharide O-acyltransferase-like enzyme
MDETEPLKWYERLVVCLMIVAVPLFWLLVGFLLLMPWSLSQWENFAGLGGGFIALVVYLGVILPVTEDWYDVITR